MTASSARCGVIALAIVVAWPWTLLAADVKSTGVVQPSSAQIARGRYVVNVGSCNDCHTADFAPREGNVPESTWLRGSSLGFKGPWGTTYAPNLRFTVSNMTEAQWVPYIRGLRTRPPMPWFNLNRWSDQDLRALYHYIRSLGPVGTPAPKYVPPDQSPKTPYIEWPAPPK